MPSCTQSFLVWAKDSVTAWVTKFKFLGLLRSEKRAMDSFAIALALAMRAFLGGEPPL